MPKIIGKNGAKTPINSVDLQPEVHAIYLKKSIDSYGVKLQMDKYAESIDVPSGLYGQDPVTGYENPNGSGNTVTSTKDVTNIRMTGKDDIARYFTYGDAGLMGRAAAVDGLGLSAYDPYHLGVGPMTTAVDGGLDDFSASFDGSGDLPKFVRNWQEYEIAINHASIWKDQLDFKKNDHLPEYEIDGYIKRLGDINYIDTWVKLLIPNKKILGLFNDQATVAAIMTDQFYRQNLLDSCSDGGSVTIRPNQAGGFDAFLERIDDIVEQLSFFEAKPPLTMQTGTVVPTSVPLEERYRILFNPKLERWIKKIPGFVHANEYGYKPSDPDEFGSYENVAFIKMDSIAANVTNSVTHGGEAGVVMSSDAFGRGMRFSRYNFLILSGKAYGMLKMRGTKNYNIHIVDGNKAEAGNPLGLKSTYGWIAFVGYIMMRPTHCWKIAANFDYTV